MRTLTQAKGMLAASGLPVSALASCPLSLRLSLGVLSVSLSLLCLRLYLRVLSLCSMLGDAEPDPRSRGGRGIRRLRSGGHCLQHIRH